MCRGKIRLLYVEDDVVDQMAFRRMIREQNLPYDLSVAGSVKAAKEVLSGTKFDLLISDFLLGDGTSFEYLPQVIKSGIPVILVTGTGDEDVAVRAIKMGASDYVIKDIDFGHLKMMPLIIEGALNQKLAEDKIKKLSMAVEQSPSMLIITDSNGIIEYVNPRVLEITGLPATAFTGTDLFDHHKTYNPPQMVGEMIGKLAQGEKWQGNTCHARFNGEILWESTTISPIYDNEGMLTGYIKVAEDITERKKSEEAIKKYSDDLRESNASKDKMFSIIAHDLRTPFNGLLSFSDILSSDYDVLHKDEILEYIKTIRELSHNTFDLLEKLLQWSRLQTGRMEFKPTRVSLQEIITAVINLLTPTAKSKHIQLKAGCAQGLNVYADCNMVNAVIRNLISNALKFTNENGSVTIEARETSEKMAEIEVADTGIGMSEETKERLFRIEYQYSTTGTQGETGTGLGLLLCREFVEYNGGVIWAESEPGKGSRFIFTLPVVV